MTDSIGQAILAQLGDASTIFVFPSEVAARNRLERTLDASGRAALPLERFISWDAFKGIVFPGPDQGRPASSALRAIFSRSLMEGNAELPFLSALVPRDRADASTRFSLSIARALPALRSIPDGPGAHLADWRLVRARYAEFLSARGLFEPGWNSREARSVPGRFVLFYPDLTTDWADYEPAVLGLPDAELMLSRTLPADPVPASTFGTLVDEVRAVIIKIRRELEAGADPAHIMISVAAPESVLPVLEREAAVAGLPLDVREARPLSESAGGRLLSDIIQAARSGRSFASLRRLLLDRSRPWKEPEAARRLIDLGIRKHIVAALPDRDVWEASMGPADDSERRLYRGLRSASDKVASAAGFGQLRSSFDAFRRAFLDEAGWNPAQNDELARCVRELEELEEAARFAGLGSIKGVVDAFLEHLGELKYLPVSRGSGVPVYRFPVAAGSWPDLHFCLNLSEGAAQAGSRPLSFLRDDEREQAGARDRDISGGLIRLLARSGRAVFPSWSTDGPDGVRPHHQALLAREPDSLGLGHGRGEWLANQDTGSEGTPVRAFPLQKAGAAAALVTVFPGEQPDWTDGLPANPATVEPWLRERILQAASSDGRISLSETLLQELDACPFKRLYRRNLRVEPVETGLSFVDALMTGSLYHDAMERLFSPLATSGQAVLAAGSEGERSRPGDNEAIAALDAAVAAMERKHGVLAGILLGSALPAMRRDMLRALKEVVDLLDGMVPVLVETPDLTAPLGDDTTVLSGRMDLVCARDTDGPGDAPRQAVIIDFKKGNIPGKDELRPDESGSLARYQMPAYAALVRAAGYEPEAAYYVSIEGAAGGNRLRCAFGPDDGAAVPAEGLPALLEALERACGRAAGILGRGEIFVPHPDDRETTCLNCGYRSICRTRYTVR